MDGNKIVPDLKENLKNISPEKKFKIISLNANVNAAETKLIRVRKFLK